MDNTNLSTVVAELESTLNLTHSERGIFDHVRRLRVGITPTWTKMEKNKS